MLAEEISHHPPIVSSIVGEAIGTLDIRESPLTDCLSRGKCSLNPNWPQISPGDTSKRLKDYTQMQSLEAEMSACSGNNQGFYSQYLHLSLRSSLVSLHPIGPTVASHLGFGFYSCRVAS